MNLFSLVFKQMRQRALGTWLTLLSVVLGVSLALVILILYRESYGLFGQTDYGYDVLIGKQGSGTQLVLNTVYMIDKSPGNIPYSMYEEVAHKREYRQFAKLVVPYVVGDSYEGTFRIIGTTPSLFGTDDDGKPLDAEHTMTYRPDLRYEIQPGGRDFLPHKLEAVVGCDLVKLPKVPLTLGTKFRATHGFPAPGETPDIHKTEWTVVGVLKPTHTAADRAVFLPYESLFTIGDHVVGLLAQEALNEHRPIKSDIEMVSDLFIKKGLPPPPKDADPDDVPMYSQDPDGTIHLYLNKEAWEVSAILVKSRGGNSADSLMWSINHGNVAQAVRPAGVMREFFDTFFRAPTLILLVIAVLVTIVAAVGILVSIYNSVAARTREIAIIRALGATRVRVLVLICTEAGIIGFFGGVIGLLVAHTVAGLSSAYLQRYLGQGIKWYVVDWKELGFVVGIVVIAVLAGFVPAAKAYRTDVATNLVSG